MFGITLLLMASFTDYLKPAEQKGTGHTLENVDFIYMINLDRRPEKFARSLQELSPYGIRPYRFSAVNGWELKNEVLDNIGIIYESWMPPGPLCTVYRHVDGKEYQSHEIMEEVGVCYFSHALSRGAIGIILSHLSVLQDAYDSNYQVIWVMEDDVKVVRDPHEISRSITILNELAPDWDIFFTDNEIKDPQGRPLPCLVTRPRPLLCVKPVEYYLRRAPLTLDITKIGMRFGAHSMIIKRSGMKKLLDFFKTYRVFYSYDVDYFLVPGINLYASNYDIVTNLSGALTDNASPGYLGE